METEHNPQKVAPEKRENLENRRIVKSDAAGNTRVQRLLSPWMRASQSISSKLILVLVSTMVISFGILGWATMRLHRKHLEAQTLTAAERMSDVIKRSTAFYMMRNDRSALYETMNNMADEPGVVRLRIFNQQGEITYSTEPAEVGRVVDKTGEACYGCHVKAQAMVKLNRPDRFRIYRAGNERRLAIITPIENEPTCSNAACHAHPASQQILGVLDTTLSLQAADANIAEASAQSTRYTVLAILAIGVLIWWFVWIVVHKPMALLTRGTERLAKGELTYKLEVHNSDEVGELADSLNNMSDQLLGAREEIEAWTHTLQNRVDQKTSELLRAHEQMVQVEKMVAIGKLAAVVAHEINNPLSGILTYAKLIKKWIANGIERPGRKQEIDECLDLVASESRRCGDLVKNLLTFSRTSPINLDRTNINAVVERCVRLIQHKAEMSAIQLEVSLEETLPLTFCDGAQIEQVVLALSMNAIDAMPRGGTLWLTTRINSEAQLEIEVRDDGMGIPEDVMPKIFEPFTTTKDVGKGVGLGLAIAKGIVERHGGRIEVRSELGHGTTFLVVLPLDARGAQPAEVLSEAAAHVSH